MGDDEFFEQKGFTNFCEDLWKSDGNCLHPDVDYDLDLQGRTRFSYDGPDNAEDPLFASVKAESLEKPTFKKFIALLDNYETSTGKAESVTPQEEKENWDFLHAIGETKPIRLALQFLVFKKLTTNSLNDFKKRMYDMWFKLYRRTVRNDSSGFEHVFVGETRGEKEVIGFHNWIQFYLQEKAGAIDYKGFMASDRNPNLITIQFEWKGETKPKGSTFVGTSPEFEMALYTVCFMMGKSAYKITLGGEPVIIKCHQTAGKIGSCFPQAVNTYRRK